MLTLPIPLLPLPHPDTNGRQDTRSLSHLCVIQGEAGNVGLGQQGLRARTVVDEQQDYDETRPLLHAAHGETSSMEFSLRNLKNSFSTR